MGLKPYRKVWKDDGHHFMAAVATRGGIVCLNGSASGVPLEQAVNTVAYIATPSAEKPYGVLAVDVVNKDLSQLERNIAKKEVNINEPCTTYMECEVTTDFILAGETPSVGDTAYLAHSGYISPVDRIGGNLVVGTFTTVKDHEGYATVNVRLPRA